ncbi:DNA cytosine methyltransferase [Streptomyces sp. A 4/2]|uniref:DNA cytosine methyltransferase n=1 Tax=Streptomyces sp. A 4/2 TaxID=2934314 RepID=UPI00202473C9|nr:DNA cytosine methyltransferase [Streptomyces sp. A 4/2]
MDLFAGCGGFAEGFRTFRNLGGTEPPLFRTVTAVDLDPVALATFEANHQLDTPECCDIKEFDPLPHRDEVDVITGGPPCQGFSSLGKQHQDDPRNALWEEYIRVVSAVRPKIFVLENVDRFYASPEYSRLVDSAKPGGPLSDYTLSTELLNAADYGVPQARKRVIAIGTHKDLGSPLTPPEPTHERPSSLNDDLLLFNAVSPRLPWVPVDTIFQLTSCMEISGTELPQRRDSHGRAGPYQTNELHFGRTPTALSMARYRAIPPGGNRADLRQQWTLINGKKQYLSTDAWDKHQSGSGDVMGRLRFGVPAVTIRTEFFKPEKGRYLHPTEHRPITHFEAALIQGFPVDYLWYGTKIQIARQIGNAVPIGMTRALAGAIYQHLRQS